MKILAVTVRRPWVFAEPLETVGSDVAVVKGDSIDGKTGRYVHIFRELRRELKTFGPDVLLVDGADLLGLVMVLFSVWYRVPLIVRLGGNPWTTRSERIQGLRIANESRLKILSVYGRLLLDRFVLSFALGCITVSESLRDEIQQQTGLPSERTAVVHYPPKPGIATEANTVTSEILPIAGTSILTVTNLMFPSKFEGVCRILKDIEEILLNYDDVAYIIAGGGSYHGQLESFIDEHIADSSVKDRIYTPGFVDDIRELYMRADIMVYVSFIDAYPNVILEAQMAQLPVVANADHGIIEQIDDGETGILIDPSHETELKEAIEYLVDHPDERTRLGTNGAHQVAEENGIESVGKRIFESVSSIYESTK